MDAGSPQSENAVLLAICKQNLQALGLLACSAWPQALPPRCRTTKRSDAKVQPVLNRKEVSTGCCANTRRCLGRPRKLCGWRGGRRSLLKQPDNCHEKRAFLEISAEQCGTHGQLCQRETDTWEEAPPGIVSCPPANIQHWKRHCNRCSRLEKIRSFVAETDWPLALQRNGVTTVNRKGSRYSSHASRTFPTPKRRQACIHSSAVMGFILPAT